MGFAFLRKIVKKNFDDSLIERFEYWLDHNLTNWAQCDDLCLKVIYNYFLGRPYLITQIGHWADAKSPWTRRAANVVLVKFIHRKIGKNIYQLPKSVIFVNCKKLLHDPDIYVQKSIGWLLKVAADYHHEDVTVFLIKNIVNLERHTLRYAIEKFPVSQRKELMGIGKMNNTIVQPDSSILKSTTPYQHLTGMNCESACQRNIYKAMGIDLDECEIFGLDGGFGFSFFPANGNNADIVIGKQAIFPLQAARLMGIKVTVYQRAGTKALVDLLDQHHMVTVRVDVAYLPDWGLNEKSSFGGYFINVIDFDEHGQQFLISDCAQDSSSWIDADILALARSSKLSPPINPNNWCCVFSPAKRYPQMDKVGPVAVRNLCREVLKPSVLNLGVPGIKKLNKATQGWHQTKQGIVTDVNTEGDTIECNALTRQLIYLGRQIEIFGTGGGLFRPMIARFLHQVSDATHNELFSEGAAGFEQSGAIWQSLGQQLLNISHDSTCSDHEYVLGELGNSLTQIFDLEKKALQTFKAI